MRPDHRVRERRDRAHAKHRRPRSRRDADPAQDGTVRNLLRLPRPGWYVAAIFEQCAGRAAPELPSSPRRAAAGRPAPGRPQVRRRPRNRLGTGAMAILHVVAAVWTVDVVIPDDASAVRALVAAPC